MFKKLLATVGIGAATVDTRLHDDSLYPGEILEGEVYIKGGDVEQDIDDIYLKIMTQYKREKEDSTIHEECLLVKYCLSERFTLRSQQKKVIPFSLQLPYKTPLTFGHQPVYLRTGLDIKTALNPRDRDAIQVRPHPLMQRVLDGIESLGFRLSKVECEYAPRWGKFPFVQEFEFRPTGKYRQHLDELEVIFNLNSDELEVLLQIDKKARGFGGWLEEAMDMDEKYVRLRVTQGNPDVEFMLDEVIQSHLR